MNKRVVLLDMGNTLVRYWLRSEQPQVLEEALSEVEKYLRGQGLLTLTQAEIRERFQSESREADDYRVIHLKDRLRRAFRLPDPGRHSDQMCRHFLKPIFARGRVYDDSVPVLNELRAMGCRTAIVSNLPWGSPGSIWREEFARMGLSQHVDEVILCTDCGYRKPSRRIFEYTLEKLQADPHECIFVGDDPRWDIDGPRAVGIEAVLIDRHGTLLEAGEETISNLWELLRISDSQSCKG